MDEDTIQMMWEELAKRLTQDEVREFAKSNPSLDELKAKLQECLSEKPSPNPYGFPEGPKRRLITDKLVFTKTGIYKDYKEAE